MPFRAVRLFPLTLAVAAAAAATPAAGRAQDSGAPRAQVDATCWTAWEPLGGPYRDLERSLSLVDEGPPVSGAIRRMGQAMVRECTPLGDDEGAWGRDGRWSLGVPEVAVLPAAVLVQNNSGYPRPQLDGLRWAGRGISGALAAAVAGRWGPLSAALAPVVTQQENRIYGTLEVRLPGYSRFANYYHTGSIDWPQRFGAGSFQWVHPGQSFVRLDAFGAAAGVSTENLRWGPGRRYPLLMGAAGPGFIHGFIGTGRPVDVGIGRLEVEAVWGRLQESEYFDSSPDNDRRLLAGMVVAFSPGSTGLTLGVARSYLRYWPDGLGLDDVVFGPYTGVRENPSSTTGTSDNQLLSAFFRWALPSAAFEVYGEYAREDHWEDFQDLLKEPDHSRAYTVGLQKVFGGEDAVHRYRLAAEASNLGATSTWRAAYRPMPTFYAHSSVRQGYTHRGQPLGAPIGPGADAQYVGFDYLGPVALGGVYLERVRYENDVYYGRFGTRHGFRGNDAELTVGVRGAAHGLRAVPGLQVVGEAAYSSRYNRGFIGLMQDDQFTHETSLALTLGVAWTPRLP